jgi:hypothetical protein
MPRSVYGPRVKLLSNGQEWLDLFLGLYGLYRRSGIEPALQEFRDEVLTPSDRQALAGGIDATDPAQAVANLKYWFEHELRQYLAVELDIDRAVGARWPDPPGSRSRISRIPGTRIYACVGPPTRNGRDRTTGRPPRILSHPAEFAGELWETLPFYEQTADPL